MALWRRTRTSSTSFIMTISTGIGGGVICDDRLLLGHHGLAAELGHVTVLPDGPMCGCGHRGHLEAVASGTAIARICGRTVGPGRALFSGRRFSNPTGRDISMAAEHGDPLAKAALARAGTFIGLRAAELSAHFQPLHHYPGRRRFTKRSILDGTAATPSPSGAYSPPNTCTDW